MPYWRLHYHFVWATTQRLPLIDDRVEALVRESLGMTISRMGLISHAIGMVEDHVHVLVSIAPTILVADVAGRLKGASTRAVNRGSDNSSFGWQTEYGVLSFSDRGLLLVKRYVENQLEHHANNTTYAALEVITPPEPVAIEPD